MSINAMEERLDDLRAPRDSQGKKYLGAWLGPYIQGATENGYGSEHLQEIRALRKAIAQHENNGQGVSDVHR